MENIERRNPEHYADLTPYEALKKIGDVPVERIEPQRILMRGEIYWCYHAAADRDLPGIVISNDISNRNCPRVIVANITNREKYKRPVHAPVVVYEQSTVLCEDIRTIEKTDMHAFVRKATEAEMEGINAALTMSIGLKEIHETTEEIHEETAPVAIVEKVVEKEGPSEAEIERDLYKQLYQDLLAKMMKEWR